MAGDWIKLEHATLDKPELGIAADLLGISEGDALMLFLRYWVWLDENMDETRCGLVPFVSRKSLERKFRCPGFAAALERIRWAQFDDEQQILTVTNWDRHNGKTAKSRALEQKKKARQRAEASRSCPDDVPVVAGPEKRREEVISTSLRSVESALPKPPAEKAKRATRLPADWELPEEWRDWAVAAYHVDPQQAARIGLAFRDWFLQAPGADGTSLDWRRRWQVWVRREMERKRA